MKSLAVSSTQRNKLLHEIQLISALMRLDRPIGSLLLLWPTLTALLLATHGHLTAKCLAIFIAGVFLVRAAGCIINDICDRNLDRHVIRTQHRPLTSGRFSLTKALIILAALLLCALLLVLQLNSLSFKFAIAAIVLTAIYPLCKRFTYYPQLVLGLAFNSGILMAFAATTNSLSFTSWLYYFTSVLWTIAYDTMYALVDREDDVKIGIKSLAVKLGSHSAQGIYYLQLTILALLVVIGLTNHCNAWYYLAIIASIVFMAYQQLLIHSQERHHYLQAFTNNNWALLMIFLGVLLNFL